MSYVAEVEATVREDGEVVINVFQNDVWIAGGSTSHNVHNRVCSDEAFWNGVYDYAKQVVASKQLHMGRFNLLTRVSEPVAANG